MNSRYTLKDLRESKGLTFEQLSEQTSISVDTLKLIEQDSGQAEWCDIATLSKLYKISPDYIYIGKQSDFNDKCIAELLDSDSFHAMPLSKRINISEILELEKQLNLPNVALYSAILQLESEVVNG